MGEPEQVNDVVLEVKEIRKEFPGVIALDNVNFKLKKGTVHALLGENGAGKSTLVKIISGVYNQTSGQICVHGREVNKMTPQMAKKLKIAVVHQELNLIPEMTVSENVFIGREITSSLGTVDYKAMEQKTQEVLKKFNIQLNPKKKVRDLSIANQQLVEIVKILSLETDIIIMDEPTDVLTDKEIDRLFEIIRNLKENGKSIIYITHRLDELKQICDEFTIFRDGKYICTGAIKDYEQKEIVALMVGRDLKDQFPYVKAVDGEEAIRLENCSRKGTLKNISLSVKRGETVGFAGLVGAGRTELARCIFGADRFDEGTVYIENIPVKIDSVAKAIESGIYYTTENRKEDGLFPDAAVDFNMTISSVDDILQNRVIKQQKENQLSSKMKENLAIKTADMKVEIKNLSGGNQQKVILARALLTHPKIMILDEPTRGIDVGAKAEIYKIINDLKMAGTAVIVISSELPELLGISDRIYVMHDGTINGEFSKEEATEAGIMQYAFGVVEEEKDA